MSHLPMIRGLASHGEAYSPAAPCNRWPKIGSLQHEPWCVNTPRRSHRYALFEDNDSIAQIAEN